MSRHLAAILALCPLATTAGGTASWPPAPEAPFAARDLTAAGRFTMNVEGPEFSCDGITCDASGRLFVTRYG